MLRGTGLRTRRAVDQSAFALQSYNLDGTQLGQSELRIEGRSAVRGDVDFIQTGGIEPLAIRGPANARQI